MCAKFVSNEFREVAKQKPVRMPGDDPFAPVIAQFGTQARWLKAVQHLRDAGELENSPKDIPKIIREVQTDTIEECGTDICTAAMAIAKPKIYRGIVLGLGDWYIKRINAALMEQPQEAVSAQ